MKNTFKKLLFILLIILIIPQTSCKFTPNVKAVSKQTYAFDTICDVTIYDMDEDSALKIIDELFLEFNRYEKLLSNKIEDSEISLLNSGEEVAVSPETLEVLEKGIYYSEKTNGIFDISIGIITDLWNFHNEDYLGIVPSKEEIDSRLSKVDFRNIIINDGKVKVINGAKIDLGGIAKGYIADKGAIFLKEKGVSSAVINLGGNIETVGGKIDEDLKIGINNPLSKDGSLLDIVNGKDLTVVTSGTYQRYFIGSDGNRYHHILDTKTGFPVDSDILQVSLISKAGYSIDCDALSTTLLSLGVDGAKEFSKEFDFYYAIILDYDGNVYYINKDKF